MFPPNEVPSLKNIALRQIARTTRIGSANLNVLPNELRLEVGQLQIQNLHQWFFRLAVDHYRLLGVFHQTAPYETAPPMGVLPSGDPQESELTPHLLNLVRLKDYLERVKTQPEFRGSYQLLEMMICEVTSYQQMLNLV